MQLHWVDFGFPRLSNGTYSRMAMWHAASPTSKNEDSPQKNVLFSAHPFCSSSFNPGSSSSFTFPSRITSVVKSFDPERDKQFEMGGIGIWFVSLLWGMGCLLNLLFLLFHTFPASPENFAPESQHFSTGLGWEALPQDLHAIDGQGDSQTGQGLVGA